jgi:CheY-like chemotaxis protein
MAQEKKQQGKQKTHNPNGSQMLVSHSNACILFIDDDELLVQTAQDMLDSLGYEAVIQTCSLEALKLFREQPRRFDLVMTDFDMPGMNGEDLARELRRIRPDIPIILCTGSGKMTREKAQQVGFDALLTKPFGLRDIALITERVLTQRAVQKN